MQEESRTTRFAIILWMRPFIFKMASEYDTEQSRHTHKEARLNNSKRFTYTIRAQARKQVTYGVT